MKRLLLSVIVAGLCMGQMCGTPEQTMPADPMQDPGRLQVNDHLRAACANFVSDDASIGALVTKIESDRLGGADLQGSIQFNVGICNNSEWPEIRAACDTCVMTIIGQVYGQ
jgi:hypothetical protein